MWVFTVHIGPRVTATIRLAVEGPGYVATLADLRDLSALVSAVNGVMANRIQARLDEEPRLSTEQGR